VNQRLILDASVLVSLLINEGQTEAARQVMKTARDVIVLRLTLIETANALWSKVRRGQATADKAQLALTQAEDVSGRVIDESLFLPEALDLALTLKAPIYDCLCAVASRREGAALVTADRGLAAKLGVVCDVVVL
jgi:predicted nucleic acid-binding protein